jgi:hypothetical protein
MASLLYTNPVEYTDYDTQNVITNISVQNLVASYGLVNNVMTPQSLYVGATGDVTIKASDQFKMMLGSNNTLSFYNNLDNKALDFVTTTSESRLVASARDFTLTTTNNASYKLNVGATTLLESNDYQVVGTSKAAGFLYNNSVVINGSEVITNSLAVGGNMTIGSNLYTPTVNLYKNTSNETIGFAMLINDRDQLEIVKYTGFSNGTKVARKVAIFGNTKLKTTDSSDGNQYQFDSMSNMSVNNTNLINNIKSSIPIQVSTSNIADYSVSKIKLGTDVGVWSTASSNIYFGSFSSTSGSVGIGTSNPEYRLEVIGSAFSTGNVLASSDARLKKDLVVIGDALAKVEKINGYTYTRIDDEQRYAGVVAQELEQVLPEAVATDKNGFKSVAYGNITSLLIEAIKDLSKEVKSLKPKRGRTKSKE